ncbi:MAG TPA: methylated-DNA--[protein]-cysteine S-methyltransferase [Bryobacteraceae bacterium]|nr:methylated-DNA--[protein]-cysteine S-methyltransferase [Bryobacteraceae bacterium]
MTEGLTLRLAASPAGLCAIQFRPGSFREEERNDEAPLLQETARQLGAYFAGRLTIFDLPLDMMGTPFELRVWNELLRIPYGETRTYAQVAEAIGSPKAVRAVGAANGANPIAIVAPCHRVIGASGKLVGYGGGLELKRRLLELERPSLFRAQV